MVTGRKLAVPMKTVFHEVDGIISHRGFIITNKGDIIGHRDYIIGTGVVL